MVRQSKTDKPSGASGAHRRVVMLSVFLMLLCGCSPDRVVFRQYQALPGQTWRAELPIRFSPEWPDSAAAYSLTLHVRHTQDYPYAGLPVLVDLIGEDGQVKRHSLQVSIADGQGHWSGSGFGTLFDCKSRVATGIVPRQARRVIVWMIIEGCDTVGGISDLGISLEPV